VIHLQLLCWILGPAFTSSRDGFCPGLQIKTGIETDGQISKQSLSKLYSSQQLRFSRDLFLFFGWGDSDMEFAIRDAVVGETWAWVIPLGVPRMSLFGHHLKKRSRILHMLRNCCRIRNYT